MLYSDLGIYLKGNGLQERADCPRCSHLHPEGQKNTLSINTQKQVWHCHRCEWSGGLPKIKYEVIKPAKSVKNDEMLDYFNERYISEKTLKDFKITSNIINVDGLKRKAIAFNYYIGNDLVNVKWRTKDKQFIQSKGGKRCLYNLKAIFNEYVVICEGEIDVLSYYEAGIEAVSVPNGASTNTDYLNEIYEILENKKIYLALDNDEAGKKLAETLSTRFDKNNLYLVDFYDCKDANEYLLKYGKNELKETINNAELYPDETIKIAQDYEYEMRNLLDNGYENGLKTGWGEFDKLFSFFTKKIMVVTGIPGSGKSTFIDELVLRLTLKNNIKAGVFSPENGERRIHLERLATQYLGKEFNQLTHDELSIFLNDIDDYFNFVEIDNPNFEKLKEKIEYLVRSKGIKIFVIDPYNTLQHSKRSDETETNYVGRFLNDLTLLAINLDLLVIVIAHPTKMRKADGQYEEPGLYNISDSANWYNKAFYGFIVHRLGMKTKVYAEKIKSKYMGKSRASVMFNFDIKTERYFSQFDKDEEIKK